MDWELPRLPYEKNALEPHMGRETLEFHYEKHHRGYLTKLQKAIGDKPEGQKGLVEIIRSAEGSVFNNAAQVWNHTFFWRCMEPKGGGEPPKGDLAEAIKSAFGSFKSFRDSFVEAGTSRFGSGYVWLVVDRGTLRCIETLNADTPIRSGKVPLLTCDVWEHAYYLDHRNERGRYLQTFVDHLINWEFVEQHFREAQG